MIAFLNHTDVPPDNNTAEREIRGVVISRKTSFHNMIDLGADTQMKWMSVFHQLIDTAFGFFGATSLVTARLHTVRFERYGWSGDFLSAC